MERPESGDATEDLASKEAGDFVIPKKKELPLERRRNLIDAFKRFATSKTSFDEALTAWCRTRRRNGLAVDPENPGATKPSRQFVEALRRSYGSRR